MFVVDLYLKMMRVEVNLEFFRHSNFDSYVDLNEDSNDVRGFELAISDSNLFPSVVG